ncbi:MAG: excinuclease ABC subunit UvrC [Candidatus Cloacimonetes bacterium]|nr:excinuclease ABC subunit UvrC [Candidatus Cloacimonadota bacterium]
MKNDNLPDKIELHDKLANLPIEPGVYLMYDKNKVVIYVGKAANLKNRVKSYFGGSALDNKTTHLVTNINDFEYIITNSEQEAFILEANLIKQYQPKYNIVLKDDKKYPFIKINLKEDFPCIEITRDLLKDGSSYYGPYTDSRQLRKLLRDLEWIFPHKTCKKNVVENVNIIPQQTSGKRACLNHQMGKCPGPCIGKISKADYTKLINKISKYLLGKDDDIIKELKSEMEDCAEHLAFEKAARLRDQMNYIETLKKKQHVYFNDLQDRDIIAFYKEEKHIAVTILKMINGKISNKEVFSFKNYADERPEAVLRAFLLQYYNPPPPHKAGSREDLQDKEKNLPFQILLQIEPDDFDSLNIIFNKRLLVPARGEYKQLIEICKKNAFDYIESIKLSHLRKSTRTIISIQNLKEFIGLKKLPRKIVCIDVSTIQGSETVSSLVFFENGKPLKKQYRHFIIKSVVGQDDFASIAETLSRYLSNLKITNDEAKNEVVDKIWEIPDLIIIDGGKGQLSSAAKILSDFKGNLTQTETKIDNKFLSIEIISIAKRIEEIFLVGQSASIIIPKTSSALKLITQIRDEAHRFAISHHRKRRSNRVLSSKLDNVKGLGEEKKFLLLKEFGSVENIKNVEKTELMKIKGIGESLADNILNTIKE